MSTASNRDFGVKSKTEWLYPDEKAYFEPSHLDLYALLG